MSAQRLDMLTDYAAKVMSNSCQPMSVLPQDLARMALDAPALELTLALAVAADAVGAMFHSGGAVHERAQRGWRLSALVAADVYYLQTQGLPHGTAADLLRYWDARAADNS